MEIQNKPTGYSPNEELQYTTELIELLYNSAPEKMTLPNSANEEIPSSGNLGLLAVGYKGILAWRKKREKEFGSRLYSPFIERINEIKKEKEAKNGSSC